jgi:V/A-type H+-transporting ATPase subunit E
MEGIEKIVERIASDAELESTRILEDARHEAQEILLSFEKLAEQAREEVFARARREADEYQKRTIGAAKQSARMAQLSARQELIDTAFETAQKRLSALPEEEYVPFLARLAFKASRSGKEQVIFNMADRARYGKKVVIEANRLLEAAGREAELTLSEYTRPIQGGLFLAEGKVEVNCSVELLMRSLRQSSAREVAEILLS